MQLATSNAQAQLYNQLITQGRDLQFKYVDLFKPSDEGEAIKLKKDQFMGTVLAYYAGAFDLRRMLEMPKTQADLMDAELKVLLEEDSVRKKLDSLAGGFSKEFNRHVRELRGV